MRPTVAWKERGVEPPRVEGVGVKWGLVIVGGYNVVVEVVGGVGEAEMVVDSPARVVVVVGGGASVVTIVPSRMDVVSGGGVFVGARVVVVTRVVVVMRVVVNVIVRGGDEVTGIDRKPNATAKLDRETLCMAPKQALELSIPCRSYQHREITAK